jgi:hypothetical protein
MNISTTTKWSNSFRERVLPLIKFIVPCRWDETHPLAPYFTTVYEVVGESAPVLEKSQTRWEFHYLDEIISSNGGLIIFGLFPESKENPRTDDLPYAGDTRGEIGRWSTLAKSKEHNNIIFGLHHEFLGQEVMTKNFQLQFGDEWVDEHCVTVSNPQELADMIAEELSNLC